MSPECAPYCRRQRTESGDRGGGMLVFVDRDRGVIRETPVTDVPMVPAVPPLRSVQGRRPVQSSDAPVKAGKVL
jgi:hypothetical protein